MGFFGNNFGNNWQTSGVVVEVQGTGRASTKQILEPYIKPSYVVRLSCDSRISTVERLPLFARLTYFSVRPLASKLSTFTQIIADGIVRTYSYITSESRLKTVSNLTTESKIEGTVTASKFIKMLKFLVLTNKIEQIDDN